MDQGKLRFIKEVTQVGGVAVSIIESEVYGAAGLDTPMDGQRTEICLESVRLERETQDEKWGQVSHSPAKWMCILMEEVGEAAAEVAHAATAVTALDGFIIEIKDLGLRVREALNDGSI